jgi:RimJ/RimL family protein N-acetyltransferase
MTDMRDGVILETERLILRPQIAEDFEPWAAMMADEVATLRLGGPQPRSVAWRGFCSVAGAWKLFGYSMFSVVEKAGGRWIGRLGPWKPEGWPGTEVGWALAREAWGQGYATEGATAAMDWAFDVLGWTEVIHCIHPENAPSQAVARRLGSRNLRVGFMPAPYDAEPVDIWGQTREAWRARRR